jgi:hypothetical protein
LKISGFVIKERGFAIAGNSPKYFKKINNLAGNLLFLFFDRDEEIGRF